MANQIYRLSEARELRGLTVAELAEKIGVSRQTIYMYESGTQGPSGETLESISTHLNFPLSFFAAPHSGVQIEDRPIYFRDLKTNLNKFRKKAQRWLALLYDCVHEFERYVSLPAVNIPSLDIGDFTTLTDEEIDICAEQVRRSWGLGDGPIDNLMLLLENNGFIVCYKDIGSEKLDACSVILEGRPYIILNTERLTCSRVLANLAHELGHIVMHQAVEKEAILDKTTHELMESQAWRFAAAFLMPPAMFSMEVGYPNLQRFKSLKKRWRTSIAFMIKHCQGLNMISNEKAQYLFRELSRLGFRKKEPFDDILSIEKTNILFDCEKIIAESDAVLKETLFQQSCLSSRDYESLIGAPEGYLEPKRIAPKLRLILSH